MKLGLIFSPLHNTHRTPQNDDEFPIKLPVSPSEDQIMKIDGLPYELGVYINRSFSFGDISMNYFTGNVNNNIDSGKISNYAWGDDYHEIIKPRLYKLLNSIKSNLSDIEGVVCIDTAPVMEKVWAQKGGIGWIGKHTNLITRDYGSWIFLGEILLNIELEYDIPFEEDLCGSCTACLDACPTSAFPEPYVLDSSKCISYLTIGHRGDFPIGIEQKLSDWIYGCDICQEVCPWNIKFSQLSEETSFQPRYNLQNKHIDEWNDFTIDEFRILFKKSAIKRTKYKGFIRNIEAIRKKKNEYSDS